MRIDPTVVPLALAIWLLLGGAFMGVYNLAKAWIRYRSVTVDRAGPRPADAAPAETAGPGAGAVPAIAALRREHDRSGG